jgi:hypothetical protein
LVNFFPKNGRRFLSKFQIFVVLLKFDLKDIFQKFKKISIQEGPNQLFFARHVYFNTSSGRESLWTSDEKTRFSMAHCEVHEHPNLDDLLSTYRSSPYLQFEVYMTILGLDPRMLDRFKSPVFANFEANLKKYICSDLDMVNGRALFGPSTTLGYKNRRGVLFVGQMAINSKLALHHVRLSNFKRNFLLCFCIKLASFFTNSWN